MLKTRIRITKHDDGLLSTNQFEIYVPQWRGLFTWHSYQHFGVNVKFNTLQDAQHFLDIKRAARNSHTYTVPYP